MFELGSLKISRGSSFEKIYEWAELDLKLELSKKSELNSTVWIAIYVYKMEYNLINIYIYAPEFAWADLANLSSACTWNELKILTQARLVTFT